MVTLTRDIALYFYTPYRATSIHALKSHKLLALNQSAIIMFLVILNALFYLEKFDGNVYWGPFKIQDVVACTT